MGSEMASFWSGKNVLVTGSGGFIGSHLTQALVEAGANVRALVHYNSRNDWGLLEHLPPVVRSQLEVVAGDVRDPFSTRKAVAGQEVVFHLAALIAIPYSYTAPDMYVDTNVKGTLNVLQACLDEGVKRLVHTSTSETYGTAVYAPIDERHPLQGQSPYSASKIGADKMAESYHRSFGLPVATVRPFNTYGPRQSARAVIPTIISQALRGDTIKLGSRTPIRDLNFVKDTVNGFLMAGMSEASVGKVINVGYGKGISVGDLALRIGSLMGKDLRILEDEQRIRPQMSEVFQLICDNRQAREILGWEPSHSLDEGLLQTISWVEGHQAFYKADRYNV